MGTRPVTTFTAVAVLFGEAIPTAGMGYDDRDRLSDLTRAAIERLRVDAAKVLH